MKLQEISAFAGHSLKGQRKTAWFMAFSYPAVWLMMKTIPDLTAGALIFREEILPADIFFSRDMFWMAFIILWNLLNFCILTPMLCAVCGWFSEQLGFFFALSCSMLNTQRLFRSIRQACHCAHQFTMLIMQHHLEIGYLMMVE